MKAMILAAGQGIRLRPLTENLPKCMVSIRGKPILEHNLTWLKKYGITDVIINLHYLPETVTSYLGDGSRWGVKITYSHEQNVMGTAGGVRNAGWFFEDAPFIVWYGDNLSNCNLSKLISFHRTHRGQVTMALFERKEVSQSGIVDLDDKDRIIRFLEKPQLNEVFSHWVNAGIYILEPNVLKIIPTEDAPDFAKDIFPVMLAGGYPLYGYRMSSKEKLWWIDTPEDLRRVQAVDFKNEMEE